MPSRPRPRPTPKAFDVFKPGKTVASPTSRPVIVSQKPQVQDHMVVEQHGTPVANTHPVKVVTRAKQPVLKSLVAPGSSNAPHQDSGSTPPAEVKVEAQAPTTPTSPTRISHTGHIIGRGAAGKHAALLHHNKISPPRGRVVAAKEPAEPEVPNLAAIPITPVEQPASLTNAKTEGKEELFAAMPVEIRRSIANAEGQSAADWEMPMAGSAAPTPAATQAPVEASVANPVVAEQSAPQQTSPTEAAVTETPPPASAKQPEHTEQQSAHAPMPLMKTERRHSDAVVFIIMLVLFVGLGAVVVMLFLTGTISV